MAALLRNIGKRLFQQPPELPRTVATSGFKLLDGSKKIEEEQALQFLDKPYYPVKLGEVFDSKYQVISKLGWGGNATVWLCRDLPNHRYAALKINRYSKKRVREYNIYEHLAALPPSNHPGSGLIRGLLGTFEIKDPECNERGFYSCFVHEPLAITLQRWMGLAASRCLPEILVKMSVLQMLKALDYLHTEADLIHTDLQPKNVAISTTDQTLFEMFDKFEQEAPCARKKINDQGYCVYETNTFSVLDWAIENKWNAWGPLILFDFGEARIGSKNEHEGPIQPDLFRAPEVILGMKWTSKVDIWNLGVMTWYMLTGNFIFDNEDAKNGQHSNAVLLSQMVAILGPPPLEFLKRSEGYLEYWDSDGNWIHEEKIPDLSFHEAENQEYEDFVNFVNFLKKTLNWVPERRPTARELQDDPWLNTDKPMKRKLEDSEMQSQ